MKVKASVASGWQAWEAEERPLCAFVQGVDLTDEELLGYISESSTMSKSIEEYEGGAPTHPPAERLCPLPSPSGHPAASCSVLCCEGTLCAVL